MNDNSTANPSAHNRDDDEKAMLEAMFAADVQNAIESEDIPQFYANSFTVTLGTGDVLIIMKRNGKSIASMQVSYTVAKSLSEVLSELIGRLEKRTGNEIMTSKFIEEKMKEGEANAVS